MNKRIATRSGQPKDENFPSAETAKRFHAALRGAMNKPRTQMKDIPRQRPYATRRRKAAIEPKSDESSKTV